MKRSTRRRLIQGVLYAVFAAVVLFVILSADWGTIQPYFFNPDISAAVFPEILTIAARNTVIYTAIAFVGGLLLGLLLALMTLSPVLPYRWLATGYIELFRGLPALGRQGRQGR